MFSILGGIALTRGNVDAAYQFAEKGLDVARRLGNKHAEYSIYCDLGDIALKEGNLERAEALYRDAMIGFEHSGSTERIASRHIDLGNVALIRGKTLEAFQHFETSLALSEDIGRQDNIARAQLGLAYLEAEFGNLQAALDRGRLAQEIFVRLAMNARASEAETLIADVEQRISTQSKRR